MKKIFSAILLMMIFISTAFAVTPLYSKIHIYSGVAIPANGVGNGPSAFYVNGFPNQGDLYFQMDGLSGNLYIWIYSSGGTWVPWSSSYFLPNEQVASSSTLSASSTGSSYIRSTYSPTGTSTITLPSSPYTGEVVQVVDEGGKAATNPITIQGNGSYIYNAGVAVANYIINNNGGSMEARYNGANWVDFSNDTASGVNWSAISSYATGAVLTATTNNGVNWSNNILISGNNVGIGSANPGQRLDVQGNVRINNGVYAISQTSAPTIANNDCGTLTQGTVVAGSTDLAGSITAGTAAGNVLGCSVTFGQTHPSSPASCICNDSTAPLALAATWSSTKVTCTALATLASATVSYQCQWNTP